MAKKKADTPTSNADSAPEAASTELAAHTPGTLVEAVQHAAQLAGLEPPWSHNTYVNEVTDFDAPHGNNIEQGILEAKAALTERPTEARVNELVLANRTALPYAHAVAESNVGSRSGTTTIDGVPLVEGNLVLLTAQSERKLNGLWEVKTGAWVRPTEFKAGEKLLAVFVPIIGGNNNAGADWLLTKGEITVEAAGAAGEQFWTKNSAGNGIAVIPDAFKKPEPLPMTAVAESSVTMNERVFEGHTEGPNVIEMVKAVDRHPIYPNDPRDPLYTLVVYGGGKAIPGTTSGVTKIHAPEGMIVGEKPSGETGDKHLAIEGYDGFIWGFWKTIVNDSAKTIEYVYGEKMAENGTGAEGVGGLSAATQSGFSLLAGPVRAWELFAGKIDHALFITIPYAAMVASTSYDPGTIKTGPESSFVYPATGGGRAASSSSPGAGKETHWPAFGGHCVLSYSPNDILKLKREGNPIADWKKTILTAFVEYGAYFGDTGGGGFEIHLEDGAAYEARGEPNPWVKYAEAHHKVGTEAENKVVENEIYKPSNSTGWRFMMNEPSLGAIVDWINRLTWIKPPPTVIPYQAQPRRDPIYRRPFAPNSPFNTPVTSSWEGRHPLRLNPSSPGNIY